MLSDKLRILAGAVFLICVFSMAQGAGTNEIPSGVMALPGHWNFTDKTGNSGTVVLPTSANPNVDGTPLAEGDYVGAFTPAGLCCGHSQWHSGSNMSITIWGDDDQTTQVDGFASGEQVNYRVYRESSSQEFTTIDVAYSEGTGNYSSNALMILSKFDAHSQTVSLPEDWQFTPGTGNNAVVVLPTAANPNIDGVPLANGDYVGVFTPAGLCCGYSAWAGIPMSITVWGDDDQTTGIDGFQTGETIGYRVYQPDEDQVWENVEVAYSEGNGNYSTNAMMVLSKFDVKGVTLPENWQFTPGTGNNATVILPDAANPNIEGTPLQNGDYVGVFTPAGLCCGYSVWNGTNTSITVWGDNDQTTELDGFQSGEVIQYHVYRPADDTEWTNVEVAYSEGDGLYAANALMILSKFDVVEVTLPDGWDYTSNTGSNATVVLPTAANPTVEGAPIANGDFVGVFTPGGLCCGWARWNGQNLALNVWGDNDQTTEVDGFASGEQLHYRAFQVSTAKEFTTVLVQYSQGSGVYANNAFMVLSQFDALSARTITLQLIKGWNMISFNVEPTDPDVTVVMGPIVSKIEIMKSGLGKTYIPQYGINSIGNINIKEGYQVYMSSAATLNVTGQPVDATIPIGLIAGWNMISYLPTAPMDATIALAGIASELEIAKNGMGKAYIPAFGINQIGQMKEGEGYQLYMKSARTLVYPSGLKASRASVTTESASPGYFRFAANTGENATVVVPSDITTSAGKMLEMGDEIGVFNESGLCCGAGVWEAENMAIPIWGDNPRTAELDGMRPGDALTFRIRQKRSQTELTVEVNGSQYTADALIVLSDMVIHQPTKVAEVDEALPVEFGISQNFPNPFNPETTIEYRLPQTARVSLMIYDARGQLVRTLVQGTRAAGSIKVKWDGRNDAGQRVASGLYIYKLTASAIGDNAASFSGMGKMILMK